MHADELLRRFTYHPPKGDQPDRYDMIRAWGRKFAQHVEVNVPESREKDLAMYHIESALMWANAAIARRE